MVFCTDILDIITKDFFARKSNSRVDDPIDPAGQGVQDVVSTLLDVLQGDHSGCSLGVVDIKTKVAF